MVADGKENLHPNSPCNNSASSGIKPKQSQFSNSFGLSLQLDRDIAAQRPLLFSEILFSNYGNHFSTTCTSPIPSPPLLSNEQTFNMHGLFNSSLNTQSTNMFGAIGSQAPLLSSSSSTASTNSDHQLDTLLWLNGVNNTAPSKSYSPPADVSEFQGIPGFGSADSRSFSNNCGNCDGLAPENHCFDCGDSLCNRCVILHLRHFHYKHHTIQKVRNGSSPPTTHGNGISFSNLQTLPPKIELENQCDMHYEAMRYVCEHCKIVVCQECTLRDHKDHQCTPIDTYTDRPLVVIQILMDKGANGKQQIKQNIDRILQFTQHLDRDANDLLQRTRKNGVRNGGGITNGAGYRNDEEKVVYELIEKFRQQKLTNFHDQTSGLRAALAGIASVTDDLKKISMNFGDFTQFQMAKILIDADHKIEHFLKQTRKLAPSPANISQIIQTLEGGGVNLFNNLQRLLQPNNGGVLPSGIANLQGANLIGQNNNAKSIRRPIVRSNRGYQNNNQQQLLQSAANTLVTMHNWNAASVLPNADLASTINNFRDGFNISPSQLGSRINLGSSADEPRAFGQCIFNSDSPVSAIQRMQSSVSFAFDGSLESQLSRPWGVCVDKDSNIIIGDRRNNRIQVFCPNGIFKFAFGTKGSADGQLELPAGVTTDRQNRIIVADKDNHRIQIFSSTGRFILKFGGYGRDLGEFQYPWDVAVNSLGNILATDTRNHRVQMFTSVGHFITKYSFDSAYYEKHLKSHITPRGVCFTPNGDILVTDFENHRIMKLDGNLTVVKMVRGREGESELHEFNRPSGLCCDDNGRIVIADSKNQRVLVYNTELELQWVLDVRRSLSTHSNEKDRPSDVAILPDGRIVVLFETSPDTKDYPNPSKTFVQIY